MKCDYCLNEIGTVDGSVIYPHRKDLWNLIYWYCKPCGAYVGCHKNSKDNAPLGRLANKELRFWKMKTHDYFDPLWRKGNKNRKEAYQWLAEKLGINLNQCHIGYFTVEICKQTVEILKKEA